MCHMQSVVSLMILFLKSIKQEFKADNFTNYNREEHTFHINKKKYICVRHQIFFFEIVVSPHIRRMCHIYTAWKCQKTWSMFHSMPPEIVKKPEFSGNSELKDWPEIGSWMRILQFLRKVQPLWFLSEKKGRT